MTSTNPQRWARVRRELAWNPKGLLTEWVRVLERHPEGFAEEPGYVWPNMPETIRSVSAHELEFTDQPSAE